MVRTPSAGTRASVKKAPLKTASAKPASGKKAHEAVPKSAKQAASGASKERTSVPCGRQQCIEVAAYFIAERRGFSPGDPVRDWLDAEAEVERLIEKGILSL